MLSSVREMVKTLCRTLCANTFEKSEAQCLEKFTKVPPSTLHDSVHYAIGIKKELQHFCKTHKNRFWILYYRYAEEKTLLECRRCGAQADRCHDYILDRILKHIKAFDVMRESEVFGQVRQCLLGELHEVQSDIVRHYTAKIKKIYTKKATPCDEAEALFENAFEACGEMERLGMLRRIVSGYRTYGSFIVLEELLSQTAVYTAEVEERLRPCVYNELIHQEKFRTYISKPIRDRLIDFTRSKAYAEVVSDEIEVYQSPQDGEADPGCAEWIDLLNEEQAIIYRLKHGFELDNRAFLTVVNRLNYKDADLVSVLSNAERFFIQMVSKYALEDDSEYLAHMDVAAIKASIESKIAKQREIAQNKSYSDYSEDGEKKDIYLKLLYKEPLSAKEIGVIFGLSAKQVDKKIENSKKKIKRKL